MSRHIKSLKQSPVNLVATKYPHDPKKLEPLLQMSGHGIREILRTKRTLTIGGQRVKIKAKQIGRRWFISSESYDRILELINT